jgi:hypothetical protein
MLYLPSAYVGVTGVTSDPEGREDEGCGVLLRPGRAAHPIVLRRRPSFSIMFWGDRCHGRPLFQKIDVDSLCR